MKSSKKRSRAVVTVVACILAVCLVAALVLSVWSTAKSVPYKRERPLSSAITSPHRDSASTPVLYNILKQVGATSGDVAGCIRRVSCNCTCIPSRRACPRRDRRH